MPVMLSACLFFLVLLNQQLLTGFVETKECTILLVTWDRNKLMFSRVDIMLTVGLRFVKSFDRFQ